MSTNPYEVLAQIVDDAPDVPDWGPGKWAVVSSSCRWWTTDPANADLTNTGQPVCPYCGAPAGQLPLNNFLSIAIPFNDHPAGPGVAVFVAAHNTRCHRDWSSYEVAAS